ncbi:hypothetical protein A2U01_0101501, partial [Trifolium medium]|nr:hypothetical protein [Trifolium medium]
MGSSRPPPRMVVVVFTSSVAVHGSGIGSISNFASSILFCNFCFASSVVLFESSALK